MYSMGCFKFLWFNGLLYFLVDIALSNIFFLPSFYRLNKVIIVSGLQDMLYLLYGILRVSEILQWNGKGYVIRNI